MARKRQELYRPGEAGACSSRACALLLFLPTARTRRPRSGACRALGDASTHCCSSRAPCACTAFFFFPGSVRGSSWMVLAVGGTTPRPLSGVLPSLLNACRAHDDQAGRHGMGRMRTAHALTRIPRRRFSVPQGFYLGLVGQFFLLFCLAEPAMCRRRPGRSWARSPS